MLKTYPYEILLRIDYENFDKAERMYKAVMKLTKEENDKDFLLRELNILYEV